jgi:hypothetical protein
VFTHEGLPMTRCGLAAENMTTNCGWRLEQTLFILLHFSTVSIYTLAVRLSLGRYTIL